MLVQPAAKTLVVLSVAVAKAASFTRYFVYFIIQWLVAEPVYATSKQHSLRAEVKDSRIGMRKCAEELFHVIQHNPEDIEQEAAMNGHSAERIKWPSFSCSYNLICKTFVTMEVPKSASAHIFKLLRRSEDVWTITDQSL